MAELSRVGQLARLKTPGSDGGSLKEKTLGMGGSMARLIIIMRDGTKLQLDGQPGRSVMENIRNNGTDELLALCGGCCSCATCHVYVNTQDLHENAPMSNDEDELLDSSSHRRTNSRLSCQIPFKESLDGLIVTIAPED
jgi:ferredoxin, 2Fe-2S